MYNVTGGRSQTQLISASIEFHFIEDGAYLQTIMMEY